MDLEPSLVVRPMWPWRNVTFPHRGEIPCRAFHTMQNANTLTNIQPNNQDFTVSPQRQKADAESTQASRTNTCLEMHSLGVPPRYPTIQPIQPKPVGQTHVWRCIRSVFHHATQLTNLSNPSQSDKHMFGDAFARWSTTLPNYPTYPT